MRKIKIAQIGINYLSHATHIFNTLKWNPDIFEVAGYCLVENERELGEGKLKHMEGYPELTLEQILNDPTIEAVTVETDEIHLNQYAILAAKAGKHIHMEKPGSQNLETFTQLIDIMRQTGKVFHLGYMYRYHPFVAEAVQRAKNKEFGHIYAVEALMGRLDDCTERAWLKTFQGGMMFYLGCHLIDLVVQIQGLPKNIIPLNTRTGIDGVDTEDLGFAVLQYENGVSVVRMGGAEIGGFERRQLVICGSKGTLEIKPLEMWVPESKCGKEHMMRAMQRECALDKNGVCTTSEMESEPFQRYEKMLLSFAEMVRGEKKNPYTLDYELELFKTILKCCGVK
jgi:predicted dehydrogenase